MWSDTSNTLPSSPDVYLVSSNIGVVMYAEKGTYNKTNNTQEEIA